MSTIRKIYWYRIFNDFMLIYPLYSVMFAQRGHLDTFQISTLLIIWAAGSLLFELPTGVLADRYSRRTLLAVGQLIRGAGYALWLVWPSYIGFAIGLIMWGIGGALDSGTFQALVYDELKAQNQEDNYVKIMGRSESIAMFVGLGATLLASPVLKGFGYGGVVGASVAATVVAAFVAASLPDKKRQKEVETPSYGRIFKEAVHEVAHNSRVLQFIGFGVLLGTLFGVMDEYASLFLRFEGVTNYFIPLVSAAMFLPSIVVGFVAHKFAKLPSLAFMLMILLSGAALFAAGKLLGIGSIIGFATFLLLTKVSMIVFDAKLQHGIRGHTRSTITSINELGVGIAAIAAYFVFGLASRAGGMSGALEAFGVGTAAIGLVMLVWTHGRLRGTYGSDSSRAS
jgi:MFS family permease